MLVSDFGLTYTYAHGRAFVRASSQDSTKYSSFQFLMDDLLTSFVNHQTELPIVRIKVKTKVE